MSAPVLLAASEPAVKPSVPSQTSTQVKPSKSAENPSPADDKKPSEEAVSKINLRQGEAPATLAASRPPVNVKPASGEDEQTARLWLQSTNPLPVLRVTYKAEEIRHLACDLHRGLVVAGLGTTNRREVFLQSNPGGWPVFAPLTMPVARGFSSYSLALHLSSFPELARTLPAYFPENGFDLAFAPDHPLAVDIFARVASAMESLGLAQVPEGGIVFEGRLRLVGDKPVFDLSSGDAGTNHWEF
jgi:hypothetical protein